MHSVEDEYHFMLVCPKYIELRGKCLPLYYCHWSNTHKFVSIMSTKSTYLIKNFSKYIHFAQIRRNEIENKQIKSTVDREVTIACLKLILFILYEYVCMHI